VISEDQPWVRQLPAPAHVPGPRWLLRLVVVAVLVTGGLYLGWRYLYSFNADYWPFAAALLGAETFSYLNTWLFGVGMWRLRERPPPPRPLEGTTVDVFITCYREPVDIVRETVVAARDIRWPHRTYVLDDGGSPAMAAMAEEVGVDYIARSSEWEGKPRHAKAGNLNNALMRTDGEIILMLDADQIPWPDILHRTLGWFNDPKMAAVQTHQWFYNVPDGDPMGSHAYLFYGPIQQAKDGWDAAFFCGSCGLLRREALMQTGIRTYVHDLDRRVREALATADRVLRRARRQLGRAERGEPTSRADALDDLRTAVAAARSRLAHGDSVQEVTWEVQRSATDISRRFVEDDIEGIRRDLRATPGLEDGTVETALTAVVDDDRSMRQLAGKDVGPLTAIATVHDLLMEVDVVRADEAQPVMPMSTMAVTEDLATAMALHSTGWDSCYHDEVLARGLAPLELRAALTQRLRWAEGTMQMLLRQNPLRVKGLSTGQRLMYMATMLSYLSGFASVVYLSAPPLYIFAGVMPVRAYSWELLAWLAPYLLLNAVLFALVGWRRRTWRGQQYALVLFPVWIRSVFHAVAEVWFGRRLEFATTPKTLESRGLDLRPVAVQLATIGVLVVAGAYGISSLLLGERDDTLAVSLNGLWIVYDLVMLSVVIKAVTFRPSDADLTRTAAAIWRDADDVPGRIGAGRR
jgi:cellulose synthase (UDP-forming)